MNILLWYLVGAVVAFILYLSFVSKPEDPNKSCGEYDTEGGIYCMSALATTLFWPAAMLFLVVFVPYFIAHWFLWRKK